MTAVPSIVPPNQRGSNYDNFSSSAGNNNREGPASLFEPAAKVGEPSFQPSPVAYNFPSAASMRPPPIPAVPCTYDSGVFGGGGSGVVMDETPNSSSASLAPSGGSASQLIQSTPPSIYQKGVSGLPSPYVQSNAPPLAIATMSTTNVNNISFIDDGASEAGDDPNLYHHRPHLSTLKERDSRTGDDVRRVGGFGGGRTFVSQPPSVPPTEEEPTIYYSLHV